jgi:hypothetical protein
MVILVGVDGSPASLRAGAYAAGWLAASAPAWLSSMSAW